MTAAELSAAVTALLDDAEALVAEVDAGTLTSTQVYEGRVNTWRTSVNALLPQLSTAWGLDAYPTQAALERLAAHLLELRATLSGEGDVVLVELDRAASLMELAVRWFGDLDRWTDLAELNSLPDPLNIPAGTEIVRHVR